MKRLALGAVLTVTAGSAHAQWIPVDETKLIASAPYDDDGFGSAIDLDGDTAVIGVPGDDLINGFVRNEGSAYVYARSGTSWVEEAYLIAGEPQIGAFFGISVALSGDTILIGAHGQDHSGVTDAGAAYVFVRTGTTWRQEAVLVADEAEDKDFFGLSVALEGDTALVAAFNDDLESMDEGAVYVFVRSGSRWSKQARLTASNAATGDRFGSSVSISGDTALIGAYLDDHSGFVDAGAAYVCVRNGTTWSEQAVLTASDPGDSDLFGCAVSVDGDTALIGAELDDVPGVSVNQGSAYVYARSGTIWTQQAALFAGDGASNDMFGYSVSVSSTTILVGAVTDDIATSGPPNRAGSAYVWNLVGGTWLEGTKLVAADAAPDDEFGVSVAVSEADDRILIGASGVDHLGGFDAGAAYVFAPGPGAPQAYCTAGVSAGGCTAAIAGYGTPSATASEGFLVATAGAGAGKNGLFYIGTNGRQANPWGNGTSYQCVAPPVKRCGLLAGAGTASTCDGSFSQDLNALWCPTCPKPGHNPGAGAVVQAQLWYRDPLNTSNQSTSLSDALELTVQP